MSNTAINVMDLCTYCELATESIQKSIDIGNYDSAHVQLSAYLLEIHSRYISGEISADVWKETVRFYTRMTAIAVAACNQ